jgi:ABC-type nitrate/sulfonate/bicarbonate transport system ATPase subunit/ABC-type transporter Mla maintaining outer membrane lipid asymmetry permease subunit MlaE
VKALARVQGLSVALPDGSAVVEATDLLVSAGEVVALLGPSGAGKTTLLRAVFSPDELGRRGYSVTWKERAVAVEPAFVPQRGALLDHLDVTENVALAQAGGRQRGSPGEWLRAVDLDDGVGAEGRSVATLSGGQAQRVAVARVLAAGRKLIVMDEPSVGLDPLGVRLLARLLVTQARRRDAGIVVITHDLALAGGAADRIYFLDPGNRSLVEAVPDWPGPAELDEAETRQKKLLQLEGAVEHLLLGDRAAAAAGRARPSRRLDVLAPFHAAGEAISRAFAPHLFAESAVVFRRTFVQSFVRPAPFYATVGALLGFTVPYVISNISGDLRPAAVFELIKGTYILSLAPPLSAIIFAATSGSAINAWLGGLRLHGQVTALEGLGVPPERYLWAPTWMALAAAYLGTFAVFTLAMIAGGWSLYAASHVSDALGVITADFVSPPPSRYPYLVRGLWSVAVYTFAIASIVVAKGRADKTRSEDVTNAMTSSVMNVTLFVVVMELLSVLVVRAWGAHGG